MPFLRSLYSSALRKKNNHATREARPVQHPSLPLCWHSVSVCHSLRGSKPKATGKQTGSEEEIENEIEIENECYTRAERFLKPTVEEPPQTEEARSFYAPRYFLCSCRSASGSFDRNTSRYKSDSGMKHASCDLSSASVMG